jgi:hypothetical protein
VPLEVIEPALGIEPDDDIFGGNGVCAASLPTRVAHFNAGSILSRQIQWTSAIHEYGDLRVREHFDRLAAEDNRRDTATPV